MLLKSNNGKLIVGYDLGSTYSRISFCTMTGEDVSCDQIETVSAVAGAESYHIPTVLCKRKQVNQWFFGREALRHAREEEGILVEDLLTLAADGEAVQIEGAGYEPISLLTLFLKRSLGLLTAEAGTDRISAMMISCENMDGRMSEVLSRAVGALGLKNCRTCFQSHMESFYYYMLYQPRELWLHQALLCDYEQDRIRVYRLECNTRTVPTVVFVNDSVYDFPRLEPLPAGEVQRREWFQRIDRKFLELVQEVCENQLISSVFLIGEDYSEEWMEESLRFLCRGRRVFQGSNLYSKGACLGMLELIQPGKNSGDYVFLGRDRLKANIGMKVLRQGEETYYALLDAGVKWYEAENVSDFYLRESNQIELLITPLTGQQASVAQITLEGLGEETVRLRLRLTMPKENLLKVEMEDLGFGDFVPATHKVWTEEIEIYE